MPKQDPKCQVKCYLGEFEEHFENGRWNGEASKIVLEKLTLVIGEEIGRVYWNDLPKPRGKGLQCHLLATLAVPYDREKCDTFFEPPPKKGTLLLRCGERNFNLCSSFTPGEAPAAQEKLAKAEAGNSRAAK